MNIPIIFDVQRNAYLHITGVPLRLKHRLPR